MSTLSKNIKRYRMQNSITQEQLAEKINVTRQAVSNWENGKTEPDIETLTKIAQIFDISIDKLVDGIPTGIKELRGKKTHLYLGIGFTLFYVISSLLMIILEGPINEYYGSTYDPAISAFCVLLWKPFTVVSGGIGISALISYAGRLYLENRNMRIVFLLSGIILSLCTTGFMILQFFGFQIFQNLTALHSVFINYYVFLCKHTILHIFGAVLLFFGLAKK